MFVWWRKATQAQRRKETGDGRTHRSWASLHHSAMGDRLLSAEMTFRSSKRAPRSQSCTISGTALLSPPAPTSWMLSIGLSSPIAVQASMTSWHRRCISGLSRCTLAKSSSALEAPDAMLEAAPPPSPISIAGPPSWMMQAPSEITCFWMCMSRMVPTPPTMQIGLWYPRTSCPAALRAGSHGVRCSIVRK